MFLLNFLLPIFPHDTINSFTIQNVPIKFEEESIYNVYRVAFTIQNVPIKFV